MGIIEEWSNIICIETVTFMQYSQPARQRLQNILSSCEQTKQMVKLSTSKPNLYRKQNGSKFILGNCYRLFLLHVCNNKQNAYELCVRASALDARD